MSDRQLKGSEKNYWKTSPLLTSLSLQCSALSRSLSLSLSVPLFLLFSLSLFSERFLGTWQGSW